MNDIIEKLLQPVSPEKPCGPDLSYDPRFEELETIAKGIPEVEIGNISRPAEPPEWGELRQKSTEFLAESKHLRAAIFLTCSALKTGGLAGFRDGVELIRGLLENYWVEVYPLLDPEDNSDPTQRLNILSALTAARGTISGWITIQEYLQTTPLCGLKAAPPFTFAEIAEAKQASGSQADRPPGGPQLSVIVAAMRGAPEQIKTAAEVLTASIVAVEGIDKALTATLTASNTISFEPLLKLLREMSAIVEGFLPGETVAAAAAAPGGEAGTAVTTSAGAPMGGGIRGPDDVVRELERICDYYRTIEPGSPVLFILRRAQKLAKMDFLQAMAELNVATPESLRPILGSVLDVTDPAPPVS
jgi:type VI secretion system protein ImpA